MHAHHEEHVGRDPAAAAAWFMAMALVLAATVALIVALIVWAPWNDDNAGSGGGGGNVPADQSGDTNAEGGTGDIDINGGSAEDAVPAQ